MNLMTDSERMPLVSVIIPAYNVEKYIEETVNLVFEQTYSNIELIVIDDGSTDNMKGRIPPYKKVLK